MMRVSWFQTRWSPTILNLSYASLDVVECQVGYGILEAIEIHCVDVSIAGVAGNCSDGLR